MRKFVIALSAMGLAFSTMGAIDTASAAKEPKKSKMGCVVGKEKWDAGAGKCVAAKAVKKAKKA